MGNFDTEETDAVMNSIFEEPKDQKEKVKKLLKNLDPDDLERILSEIKNEASENQ